MNNGSVGNVEDRLTAVEEVSASLVEIGERRWNALTDMVRHLDEGVVALTAEVRANHAHDIKQDRTIAQVIVSPRAAGVGVGIGASILGAVQLIAPYMPQIIAAFK